jgi:hypothetical protein
MSPRGRLIRVNARASGFDQSSWMAREKLVNAPLCPSCSKNMDHVRTIWRAFGHDSVVFQCRPCGVSLTEARQQHGESKPGPAGH